MDELHRTDRDDEVSLDELLTYGPWLERVAHHLVRDVHSAEDALQDTWLNALRRRPAAAAHARAWLRTVLTREVFEQHRRQQRRVRHEALAQAEDSIDPEIDSEVEELQAEVLVVFRRLREPYRSTLHMQFFEGLSSAEIAARQGIPAATVRWRVMEGLNRLREEFERRDPGM